MLSGRDTLCVARAYEPQGAGVIVEYEILQLRHSTLSHEGMSVIAACSRNALAAMSRMRALLNSERTLAVDHESIEIDDLVVALPHNEGALIEFPVETGAIWRRDARMMGLVELSAQLLDLLEVFSGTANRVCYIHAYT